GPHFSSCGETTIHEQCLSGEPSCARRYKELHNGNNVCGCAKATGELLNGSNGLFRFRAVEKWCFQRTWRDRVHIDSPRCQLLSKRGAELFQGCFAPCVHGIKWE